MLAALLEEVSAAGDQYASAAEHKADFSDPDAIRYHVAIYWRVYHEHAATFLALLVTGQMLGSITFDHFGWLGLTQRPIDAPRLIGVALLIGGVVLIRR